jgi:hypothetical protein
MSNLKKLDDIFIGYESGSKTFRAYDPLTRKVHVTRDMIFEEQAQWDWAQGGGCGEDTETFSIEMEYTTTVLGAPAAMQPAESLGLALSTGSPSPPPQSPPPSPAVVAREEVQHGEHGLTTSRAR